MFVTLFGTLLAWFGIVSVIKGDTYDASSSDVRGTGVALIFFGAFMIVGGLFAVRGGRKKR